ncbi:MAG: hypothetical protein VKL39_03670 [Leptolyngbyaceae bacterium]|nr:hypothetical protein [Leptolyngbyaceae bacterium]
MVNLNASSIHTVRRYALAAGAMLSFCTVMFATPAVRAQDPSIDVEGAELEDLNNPELLPSSDDIESSEDDLRPLSQGSSFLSLEGGERLMNEASEAVSAQNYELAVQKLQEARQVYNQLSNFYQQLAGSFSGIDNRIADSQRQLALETAQMRDQATYQLALVHRAQNQPDLAVPLLVQIISSQQPTRDLGQRAYRQLFELGFVDSPYPRGQQDSETSSIR